MSDFGLFESDEASQAEPQRQARTAAVKLDAAIHQVRHDFGRFLMGATGIDEFGDRWHLSKNDIRKAVEAHVFPNTGTMRRIQNAMKADWKLAHPYKLALGEGETPTGGPLEGPMDLGYGDLPERLRPRSEDDLDMPMVDKLHQQYHDDPFRKHGPELDPAAGHAGFGEFSSFGPDQWDYDAINRMTDSRQEHERGRTSNRRYAEDRDAPFQDIDETYHPSGGNLIPEGDFEGYKDSVDQDGPAKVQRDFTPGGDSGHNKNSGKHNLTPDSNDHNIHPRHDDWVEDHGAAPALYSGDDDDPRRYVEWTSGPSKGPGTHRAEAARLVADIYTDFARSNGMRVASLETLNHYASTGIQDADYRLLQALIIRQAECDEECDDEEEEAPSASESDESESGDDEDEDYDFGGEDDAEDEEDDSDDYDFGGEDEGSEEGDGGEQYTVPDHAPDLDPEMLNKIPHDNPQGAAPVPPEVIDSLLGLPEGTIEQLLLEEVEQGQGGGDPGMSGPPMPPEGAPQDGGEDFFGGGGGEPEPPQDPRLARLFWAADAAVCDDCGRHYKTEGHAENCGEDLNDSDSPLNSDGSTSGDVKEYLKKKRSSARSFWAAEGDPEQEFGGGGGEQAAPAQDPAAAGGIPMDPAAMGGQPMMPPPGAGAVQPPAPPQPLENQPAEDALLDTANQAIMQMIDQETQEYQQIIDPLSQALQAIQFAQQVEQSEHPMDVTPPEGTVNVDPSQAPGGQPPMQQQAMRRWAGEHNAPPGAGEDNVHGGFTDWPGSIYQDRIWNMMDEHGIEPDGRNYRHHQDRHGYEASRRRAAAPDRKGPWSDVTYHQGDDYNEMADMGPEEMFHHMKQWDYGDDDNVRDEAPWGTNDRLHSFMDGDLEYVLSEGDGGAGLVRRPINRQSRRQAKVEFGIRNAAALIASRYRLSSTGHQMLLSAALGRRGYEHVVEALKLVPAEVRKAAAIHMSHLFAAGNDRFNKDVFMKTVMASNPRDRAGDAWRDGRDRGVAEHGRQDMEDRDPEDIYREDAARNDGIDFRDLPGGPLSGAEYSRLPRRHQQGSRGRHPFDRPRLAGETWMSTPTMDAYEPDGQVIPEITDNMTINDLPKMPGAEKHRKATSQRLEDQFSRWTRRRQEEGQSVTDGEAGVHNFLQHKNSRPGKTKVKSDGANILHRSQGLTPDAKSVPKAKPIKAVNPALKGKGSKTPAAPKAKAPAPKAAPKPKAAQRTASFFTRKVPGWRWDDHLSGYLSKEARAFTCSCGQKIAAPSYKTCSCGKVWNVYAIGDSHHLASDTAEVYIAREIPVRPGVVMANRKMAWDEEPFEDAWSGNFRKDRSDFEDDEPFAQNALSLGVDGPRLASRTQKSHAELVAMIDRLADWTKYDGPDPTRDPKAKPPSTKIKSQPGDWTNRDFTGPTKGQWREPDPTELPRKTRKKK